MHPPCRPVARRPARVLQDQGRVGHPASGLPGDRLRAPYSGDRGACGCADGGLCIQVGFGEGMGWEGRGYSVPVYFLPSPHTLTPSLLHPLSFTSLSLPSPRTSARLFFYSGRDEAMLTRGAAEAQLPLQGGSTSASAAAPAQQHPLVRSWHHGLVSAVTGVWIARGAAGRGCGCHPRLILARHPLRLLVSSVPDLTLHPCAFKECQSDCYPPSLTLPTASLPFQA